MVEDHPKLALTVATGLRHAGMAVDVAFDGHDGHDGHDALDHLASRPGPAGTGGRSDGPECFGGLQSGGSDCG